MKIKMISQPIFLDEAQIQDSKLEFDPSPENEGWEIILIIMSTKCSLYW